MPIAVLRYTGMTAEASSGMARISGLLRVAGAAVFFIACANVASFLLARASARSLETSVRVALGASRGQLAHGLLSDSVLISVIGGAFGMLLALWTTDIVPALLFAEDAERLVFAPDLVSTAAVSAVCVGITMACGLMPLFELRHDNPAAVLKRESTGPSKAMRRLRAALVVAQMACCCVLVVSTALLVDGFRAALQTDRGQRLGQPMLATAEARLASIVPISASNTSRTWSRWGYRCRTSLRPHGWGCCRALVRSGSRCASSLRSCLSVT